MTTSAVLFDFDGVIADTENVHIAAWERTFGRCGWDVSPEVCARAAEVDDREFLRGLFAERSIEGANIDAWVALKQALVVRMLSDYPRVYPGVPNLIASLAGRVRLGVVSTTWRENIAVVLRKSGLEKAFEVVVGKEDVDRTKPDPEGYRLALRRLKIRASEAVALEDSPGGLAAARSSGIRGVAVGHRRGRGAWSEGSEFVETLNGEMSVLKALDVI